MNPSRFASIAATLLMVCLTANSTERTPEGTFYPGGRMGNGVIQIEMNGRAINGPLSPMITHMTIGGGLDVVPRENAGAGFQFSSRSEGGNKYNPTIGGDCVGRTPDIGPNYIQNFQPLNFIPAENGTLFGVQPLLYQGDQIAMAGADPACTGNIQNGVQPAPYFFHFGALLGDGNRVPKQAMLIVMAINKLNAQAPHLSKYLTEAPAMFLNQAFAFAYTAVGKPQDMVYLPLQDSVTGSNNVNTWQRNFLREVRTTSLVMQCTAELATNPLCVAIYSDFGVKGLIGRREGSAGLPDLIYMGLTGAPACNPATDLLCNAVKDNTNWIVDSKIHTLSRIVAVGNPETIRAAIAQTLQAVPITSSIQW